MIRWLIVLLVVVALVLGGCAEKEKYTLTMAVNGNGSTSPAVGQHTYEDGQVVTITATADSGWAFDNWTGDVADANSAATTVTMNADKTVTANFLELFTLTMAVNDAEGGTTDPAVGDHDYAEGTVVDITATPPTDWVFDSWTGDVVNPNSSSTTVTMGSDKTVTANFGLSETPTPPAVGTTWLYEVTYEDEVTEWTVTVVDREETVDSIDTYVTEAAFDPVPLRDTKKGVTYEVLSVISWLSKTTLDNVKGEAGVTIGGFELTSCGTRTHTGDNGAPMWVGKTWSYDEYTVQDPPLESPYTNTYEVEVVALEDVTVPAGTFSCYKIEYTMVVFKGDPEDPPTMDYTEWWSPEVKGVVKVVNDRTVSPETRVLVSYTPA